MIKHIFFDWDNTLSITEPITYKIENEAAKILGIPLQNRQMHKKTIGKEFRRALMIRFPNSDVLELEKLINEELFPRYVKNRQIDIISNNNIMILKILNRKGYKLHILTSRRLIAFKHIINSDKLRNIISKFYYFENTKYVKPDKRVFNIPLKELKTRPKECLYVGDSLDDICAKKAGLKLIISLESKIRTRDEFPKNNVDAFIKNLAGLPKELQRFND